MDDLEITKLCAEAMGYKIDYSSTAGGGAGNTGFDMDGAAVLDWHNGITFNPLHDDAQAMALVKEFYLNILSDPSQVSYWEVNNPYDFEATTRNDVLNRAICECVAKMQEAKA